MKESNSIALAKCEKCGEKEAKLIGDLCESCFLDSNLPAKVQDRPWVHVDNVAKIMKGAENRKRFVFDGELAAMIMSEDFVFDRERQIIRIETSSTSLSVPITVRDIDALAERSGILIGKWLVYRMNSEIDIAWKTIAKNVWRGHLGISAKASTAMSKRKRHVICVYTSNYLDLPDVKRVREKLRNLGFDQKLCYKPDIYTYLGIYYNTTKLSPCRYRM